MSDQLLHLKALEREQVSAVEPFQGLSAPEREENLEKDEIPFSTYEGST